MYEELISDLREEAEWAEGNEWQTPIMLSDHLKQAADAIEGLQEDNAALNGTVTNLLEQIKDLGKPRWIPVTERLPKEYTEVLVFTRTGNVAFDRLESLVAYCIPDFRKFGVGAVTHWMPLPQLPKEET